MTVLLTGGTGKTSLPLARLLHSRTSHTILLASRKGTKPTEFSGSECRVHGIKFDWFDRASWANPFTYVSSHELAHIDRIYLVAPSVWHVEFMNDFIDFARERGCHRFVLISASQATSGGASTGQVHAHLKKLGKEEERVEWTVLRPTWFMENFGDFHLPTIRDDNAIYSVWEDGKVPFVSVEDIAASAFKGLMDEPSPDTDWIVHGPELFTIDEIAALLTTLLSRTITHKRITTDEYIKYWDDIGLPELGRGVLEEELNISHGSEEAIFKCEGAVVGKVTIGEYFNKNKHLWIRDRASES